MSESENRIHVKTDISDTSIFRNLPIRIIIPVVFTIILFILTIFLLILPLLQKTMMDGKREGIRHLTESAWRTLKLYHDQAEQGILTLDEAQMRAINHLQQLRYGPESKDYFWQWKEDSEKIVPKISHVRGFEPWGWVIGTGIYVEDVREDITRITRRLTYTCLIIMFLILLLSGYIIWQSAKANQARINAQEQSHLREKQLLHADKMTSLGILVAGVAHEINNPATSMMLNAPNLKKAWNSFYPILDEHFKDDMDAMICMMPYGDLRSRIESMLTAIEDGAFRIKRIINELKDFSRPSGAKLEDSIEVNQVVNKSLGLMKTIIRKTTSSFSVTYEAGLPLIEGSPHQLQQVIVNLLVNACQATVNHKQPIQVSTSMDQETGFIIIEIKDHGQGVQPDDLKKLKEPFFTTRRDKGGTGLGLSISAKIVSDHRGLLEFNSEYGNGMTAKVYLPYQTQEKGINS